MRLLVTGATGFVGRNLVLRAIAENRYDEIWAPVRSVEKLKALFISDGFEGIPSRVRAVETSAPDWNLDEIPPVDHVVHSAGVLFARDRDSYFNTNVEGSLKLFQALKVSPEKAIVLSSQAASGPCGEGVLAKSESDRDEPVTWYGHSKLSMESELLKEFPDLNVIFLRPPMILGPRDQASLPLFRMVRRGIFFKPGMKSKYFSYISVFDLVSAVFAALDGKENWNGHSRKVYFVASQNPVSDGDLIRMTAKASLRRGILFPVPQWIIRGFAVLVDAIPALRKAIPTLAGDRAKEVWPNRWVVSPGAFQEAFQWKPLEELSKTLEKTREWYEKNGML